VTELNPAELVGVADAMSAAGADVAGPLRASLIAGGRSNLTFRLDDGVSSWVLRMPPRAGRTPSAHDVAREHRVTSALGATDVPVATAVLLHEDEALLGGPFTVSAFVNGAGVRTQADLAGYDDDAVASIVDSMVAALVALHRVDHVAVGLERFGRPDAYAARQLKRWSGQWSLVSDGNHDDLAHQLIARLGQSVPEQRATSIVHGDYRIDNTLLTRGVPTRVAAVVDWELSTIGDPVADVAMMCAYRDPVFDLILGEPSAWTSPRLPSVADFAEAYVTAGGVELADWSFHLALAYFKVAAIAAGIDHRRRQGAGAGPGFDTAAQSIGPYLELTRAALI